jgi:alkanesulfonate monooxygenase SsuD/methylene tetrahydromethanopterin reductase-like flavin-dependent oxidoreductase (luciferase family)
VRSAFSWIGYSRVGLKHSAEFLTSSPAVVLDAVAARTTGIRLTSATTLLGVADPVRVYEDWQTA